VKGVIGVAEGRRSAVEGDEREVGAVESRGAAERKGRSTGEAEAIAERTRAKKS